MNFILFRPKWTEFLISIYNLELEYPLFHLGSKSSQFQGISMCFGKYWLKLKIQPICVLGLLHSSQRSKKKIQVMDKAQVLPLKLTSSSLCLCHFQREKEGVWDFYEALNKKSFGMWYLDIYESNARG